MTENEAFIYESIFNQVRMGFLSLDEIQENILEEIEDNEFEDEISEEWAFDKIREENQKLLSESKQWKSPTDTERLIKAFDELCDQNIVALHNAGYTTSDGECLGKFTGKHLVITDVGRQAYGSLCGSF